jgi:NitT/TauT family transport system substrate-binding protein
MDIIFAPINLGATMYNKTGNYVLGATVTWGNLYFASRIENFTLQTMNDKDVVFFGEGTINQYVVETVLEYNNITPKSITYLGATNLTQGQLIANESVITLVAEPALSVAKSKVQGITSISVQDLYATMTNSSSYPQAGCFIRKKTIEEHKSVVDKFIKDLESSCNKVNKNTSEIAQYSEELEFGGKKAVLEKAIPNSNIKFVKAVESKQQINTLFENALKYCGGKLPDDNFYYQK